MRNEFEIQSCNQNLEVASGILILLQPSDYWRAIENGNIFRVTGPLRGETTVYQWIPLTKASDGTFDVFFDLHLNKRLSKHQRRRWIEMPSRSLYDVSVVGISSDIVTNLSVQIVYYGFYFSGHVDRRRP